MRQCRRLSVQSLETRQLMAGDLGLQGSIDPLYDFSGDSVFQFIPGDYTEDGGVDADFLRDTDVSTSGKGDILIGGTTDYDVEAADEVFASYQVRDDATTAHKD